MTYKVIDGCPCPAKMYDLLAELKKETGCVYQSIYRGTDARALLNKYGKHDQAWLFANLPPGVANPPGRSSHELRSDGVAYVGPIGRPLFWWQCGLDIDDAHVAPFIKAASRHGFFATITYPTSRVEYHHVNFRKEPVFNIFRPLKKGSKGPRVKILSRRLAFIRKPDGKTRYLPHSYWMFNSAVENALKAFQRDHHRTPDGVFGEHTAKQLDASVRYWKQKEK